MIARRIEHLNRALPDALVDVPPALIETMPVNEKDRHVLALAVYVGTPTIVTDNLADFPADRRAIRRRRPSPATSSGSPRSTYTPTRLSPQSMRWPLGDGDHRGHGTRSSTHSPASSR